MTEARGSKYKPFITYHKPRKVRRILTGRTDTWTMIWKFCLFCLLLMIVSSIAPISLGVGVIL